MVLRPHHIYCIHFLCFSDPSRGREFEKSNDKIKMLFKAGKDKIEVKEGPDFLCAACPYFNGQGCSHPKGDEKAVSRWDARILEGLGLEAGQVLTVYQLKSLIKKMAPLKFCLTRCSYYRDNRCNPIRIPESLR